jgi:hypothetical protein
MKKHMVRRVGHFERYQYGERFFHRKVKNFHLMRNPPSAYKHFSSTSSCTLRNRRAGPKTLVYARVAKLGYFSPKKANLGIFLKNFLGIFRPT